MDIQRTDNSRFRQLKNYRVPLIGIAAVLLISVSIRGLSPSTPSVKSSELWISEVQRGAFTRQVRGPGRLVSNQVRWLTARSPGRVEQIHQLAGSEVNTNTLLIELSNPELTQLSRTSRLALIAAEAEHKALLAELAESLLTQDVRLLEARTNLEQAEFRYQAELKLAEDNIISGVDLNQSRLAVQQNTARLKLEHKRSAAMPELHQARIAASEARLTQFRETWQLHHDAEQALKVMAGIDGVLQELPLEQGQQVDTGSLLARVANPRDLRAELRIAETQAKDIDREMLVTIDIRNGTFKGRVSRLDPAVENGTVTLDVRFTESLPTSARIDQSVDGSIELESFNDTLFVERPSQFGVNGYTSLFRLNEDGSGAVRTSVRTGASSIRHVQILDGLAAGDRIVLSDLSRLNSADQIVLE